MSDNELEYKVPGEDEPGYLKRWEGRVRYQRIVTSATATPDEVAKGVFDYLSIYITKPKDPKKQIEALQNASRKFIQTMIDDIAGEFEADPNT